MEQLSQKEFNKLYLKVVERFLIRFWTLEDKEKEILLDHADLYIIREIIKDWSVVITTDDKVTCKNITIKDLNEIDLTNLTGILMITVIIQTINMMLSPY